MAEAEWFEIPGEGMFPNLEAALVAGRSLAGRSDREVEISRCTRTLVIRMQRTVTIEETDATKPA